MKKVHQGISLISLIITIIVIVILAGFSIFSGFGVIDKANFSKFANDIPEEIDGDRLVWYVKRLNHRQKDIIEIDNKNNNLTMKVPEYKDRTWKIDIPTGIVYIDPPYDYSATYAPQSTTGNIYGVYDMSGGSWEYVFAYINNTENIEVRNVINKNLASKYFNVYKYPNTASPTKAEISAENEGYILGDATWETSTTGQGQTSWDTDVSDYPQSNGPFFIRGNGCGGGSASGIFAFGWAEGKSSRMQTFRPTLAF